MPTQANLPAPVLFCQSVESELWGNCGLVYRSVPFCLVVGTCPPPVPHATSSRWVFTDLGCSNVQKKGAPAAGLYTVANRKVLYIIFFLLLLILILLLLLFVT